MSLLEQPFLGYITDPQNSDVDQTEINEELLKEHDSIELIRSMDFRISEPMFSFLISNLNKNDIGYFTVLLSKIIKTYHLNYLKLYKEVILEKDEYVKNILKLIIYIKINLINLIETKQLDKDITREELEKFLIIQNAPKLFIDCIKYIDHISYKKFINQLFIEVTRDFIE